MAIVMPSSPSTRSLKIDPIDNGFIQRGSLGGGERIERPGSRYRVTVTWPVMPPDVARPFIVRLERGRRERVQLPITLLGAEQAVGGSPVVNGNDSGGTVLKLAGLIPGQVVAEGYWLNLTHAGRIHLHKVCSSVVVSGPGTATIAVEPPLRVFPANLDPVNLTSPMIEGLVVALEPIELPHNRRIVLTATIEEVT